MSAEEVPGNGTDIITSTENKETVQHAGDGDSKTEGVETATKVMESVPAVKAKKRLTLQERLELAAQKKGKASEKKKKNSKDDKSKEASADPNPNDNTPETLKEGTPSQPDEEEQKELAELEQLIPAALRDEKLRLIEEIQKYAKKQTEKVSGAQKSKITELEKEVNKLKSITKESSNNSTDSDLLRKLQEKEHQVHALLEEGSKLSQKEVTLTQTIKRLKSHETELEDDIEKCEKTIDELNAKVEKLESKLTDFDRTSRALTEEKYAYETLQKKYDSLVIANDSLTDELKEIKFSKLDVQLKDAQEKIKDEEKKLDTVNEKYEKLEVLFKQQKEETSMTISNLRKDLKSREDMVSERNMELKRLEEKVEALRFENESAMPTETIHTDSEMIQQQYEQARENWKMIESSYLKKISDLETQMEEVQSLNFAYSKKIKILNNDIKQKSTDYTELEESNQAFASEIEALKKKTDTLYNNNKTLNDNLQVLKDEFSKQKETFEAKVHELEQERENLEATLQIRTNELNSNVPQNSFYLQDLASASSMNLMKSMNNPTTIGRRSSNNLGPGKRFSVQMGESATTPRGSTSNQFMQQSLSATNSNPNYAVSFQKLNNMAPMTPQDKVIRHQSSMVSMDSNDTEPLGIRLNGQSGNGSGAHMHASAGIDNVRSSSMLSLTSPDVTAMDSYSLVNDDMPLGMDAETEHMQNAMSNGIRTPMIDNSTTVGESGPGLNIQLIKKLGTQVRMLELEVSTLRDEAKALSEEKEAASKEIVRLMEDNDKVTEVKGEVLEKDSKIEELEEKYQRVLVILGEKEERVGELNADVEDLKDMLRQQVQQMVDMQEKINALNKTVK